MTEIMASERNQANMPGQREGPALGSSGAGKLVSKLRRILPPIFEPHPVCLAYLYGSATTGRTTPMSDVDVALIIDQGLSPLERLKLLLRIQLDLLDQGDIANADVRIVNDAPVVFRGRVVTDGLLIYARNEQERIDFETTTRLRYFDYQPVHRMMQDAFFADLRERGLYG
jgi:predicted nucleotidyltransferase